MSNENSRSYTNEQIKGFINTLFHIRNNLRTLNGDAHYIMDIMNLTDILKDDLDCEYKWEDFEE